jgi:hypothetical protein
MYWYPRRTRGSPNLHLIREDRVCAHWFLVRMAASKGLGAASVGGNENGRSATILRAAGRSWPDRIRAGRLAGTKHRPDKKNVQLRTVPLKRLKRHLCSPSTLAILVACRGSSVTPGGHCPRAGVWSRNTARVLGAKPRATGGVLNQRLVVAKCGLRVTIPPWHPDQGQP